MRIETAALMPCYECGTRRPPQVMHPVAGHYLCDPCGEKIRDVMELAAALQLSIFDLCAAVT